MSTPMHAFVGVDPVGIVFAVVRGVAGLVVASRLRGAWPWLACGLTAADPLVMLCSVELFDEAPLTETRNDFADDY